MTREHFRDDAHWEERVSPLRPELKIPASGGMHVDFQWINDPVRVAVILEWLLLFFVACHLPALNLAETRADRTIHSLVMTAAGWQRVALAKQITYGGLAIALAATVGGILRPEALMSPAFWFTISCAAIVYLGVAFVIGSWSTTTSSASAGIAVYLMLSATMLAIGFRWAAAGWIDAWRWLAADAAIQAGLTEVWSAAPNGWALGACAVWVVLWHLAGAMSFERVRRA